MSEKGLSQYGGRQIQQAYDQGRKAEFATAQEYVLRAGHELAILCWLGQEVEIIIARIDESLIFNIKSGNRDLMLTRLSELSAHLAKAATSFNNAVAMSSIIDSADTANETNEIKNRISDILDGIEGILLNEKTPEEMKEEIEGMLGTGVNTAILEKIAGMKSRGRKRRVTGWRLWLYDLWLKTEAANPDMTPGGIKIEILRPYWNPETRKHELDDVAKHVRQAINRLRHSTAKPAQYRQTMFSEVQNNLNRTD